MFNFCRHWIPKTHSHVKREAGAMAVGKRHRRRRRRIRHRRYHASSWRRPNSLPRFLSLSNTMKKRIITLFLFWFFLLAVNDGRVHFVPSYKNTAHAIFTIARSEVTDFFLFTFWFFFYWISICFTFRRT